MPTEDPYTGFPHYPKVERFCEAKIAKVIEAVSLGYILLMDAQDISR